MTTIIKGFGGSDDKKKYLYNIYTVSTSQSGANIQIRKFLIDKNMELVTLVDTPGVYQSGNIMYDDEILKITYGNIYTFNWELHAKQTPLLFVRQLFAKYTNQLFHHWDYRVSVDIWLMHEHAGGVVNRLVSFIKSIFYRLRGVF